MGCPECDRLRNHFNAVIQKNRQLLSEFEASILNRDSAEIERLRLALLDIEEKRRETRVSLLAHDATHEGKSAAGA